LLTVTVLVSVIVFVSVLANTVSVIFWICGVCTPSATHCSTGLVSVTTLVSVSVL
jgi:hypothetical protein